MSRYYMLASAVVTIYFYDWRRMCIINVRHVLSLPHLLRIFVSLFIANIVLGVKWSKWEGSNKTMHCLSLTTILLQNCMHFSVYIFFSLSVMKTSLAHRIFSSPKRMSNTQHLMWKHLLKQTSTIINIFCAAFRLFLILLVAFNKGTSILRGC